MVIGILVSPLLSFSLATADLWRFLFALTPALAIFQLVVSPFLLESPRWLLSQSEHSIEARCVIKALRGFRSDEEVENEVSNFLFASAKHKTGRASAHSTGAIMDLFRVKSIRILVISSLLHATFGALTTGVWHNKVISCLPRPDAHYHGTHRITASHGN